FNADVKGDARKTRGCGRGVPAQRCSSGDASVMARAMACQPPLRQKTSDGNTPYTVRYGQRIHQDATALPIVASCFGAWRARSSCTSGTPRVEPVREPRLAPPPDTLGGKTPCTVSDSQTPPVRCGTQQSKYFNANVRGDARKTRGCGRGVPAQRCSSGDASVMARAMACQPPLRQKTSDGNTPYTVRSGQRHSQDAIALSIVASCFGAWRARTSCTSGTPR